MGDLSNKVQAIDTKKLSPQPPGSDSESFSSRLITRHRSAPVPNRDQMAAVIDSLSGYGSNLGGR